MIMRKLKPELELKPQMFNQNPQIKQGGKMVNLKELVKKHFEDSDIYATLYKYGSLDPLKVNFKEVQEDYIEILEMKDILKLQDKAKELFENLPALIKNKFDNSYERFYNEGKDFFKFLESKNLIEKTGKINAEELNNEQKQ